MALSQLLTVHAIPHAFHGSILTAVMSDSPRCDVRPLFSIASPPHPSPQEIFCIVEGGSTHPFRRVRQAIADSQNFTTTHSPWSNR